MKQKYWNKQKYFYKTNIPQWNNDTIWKEINHIYGNKRTILKLTYHIETSIRY